MPVAYVKAFSGQSMTERPCELIGAGKRVSALWKRGDEQRGYHYRFDF
jgi:hypothetical protein